MDYAVVAEGFAVASALLKGCVGDEDFLSVDFVGDGQLPVNTAAPLGNVALPIGQADFVEESALPVFFCASEMPVQLLHCCCSPSKTLPSFAERVHCPLSPVVVSVVSD